MSPQVAIIGAGVAGLACANALRARGISVLLFDKGRGPGGRLSTRRTDFGAFDHGTPSINATDTAFAAELESARSAGAVETWGAMGAVGVPGMNGFVKYLARGHDPSFGVRLAPLQPHAAGQSHTLVTETGEALAEVDWVVVATPAPQAAELLTTAAPSLADAARAAEMAPQWTSMVALPSQLERCCAQSVIVAQAASTPLDMAVRESAKPGRANGERWVLHATLGWSQENLELPKETVAAQLLEAFRVETSVPASPTYLSAHRWRYARVFTPVATEFGLDPETRIATCGDWHLGPNAEHAWLSGTALGQQLPL